MGIESFMDYFAPVTELLGASDLAAATTEYPIFDTTRIAPMAWKQDKATFTYRRSCGHIKRVFLSVYTDQALTLFVKHLCAAVTSPSGSSWDIVPDALGSVAGTAIAASKLYQTSIPMFGDDHLITLKTGGTPPTALRISMRFTPDQALNA